jgi:DNA-directed RNA polymerase specialized sigma54-like protein
MLGLYCLQQIADAFAVHYSTVSRVINKTSFKNLAGKATLLSLISNRIANKAKVSVVEC